MKCKLLVVFVLFFGWNTLYAVQVGSFDYCLDDIKRTAAVCGLAYGEHRGNIIIPSYVTYEGTKYRVTVIENAFMNCIHLKSVTIPESVKSIWEDAFYGCINLMNLTIPNSVTSIGENAFYDVPNVIYNGGAQGAPWGAKSVNGFVDGYLVFKDSTKTILQACSSMATGTVTIPNSVTSIGERTFESCTGLTAVVWNAKKCTGWIYSKSPFYSARDKITSFTFGDEVESFPAYLCQGMSNLTSVTIPDSVTSIGRSAFSGCTGLTSVTIPSSATSIGDSAFYGCTGLTSITIGNNVTSIGKSAFEYCTGLTSVTIPNSVTSIGSSAFYNCTGLTSVTIGNSVTSIGNSAFFNCMGLTSITIPNNVLCIEYETFKGCTGLTSVIIGNSVKSIGNYAFYNCTGLTSVTIGKSVTSIGYRAFYNCTGLTSVVWNAKKCDGWSYAFLSPFYDARNNITSFIFGDEVERIPTYLCYGMINLTSITVGNSVKSIGDYAFYNCTGLTSVTIGKCVTSIGQYAFYGCRGLTSVVWNAKKCGDVGRDYYSSLFYDVSLNITSFIFGNEVDSIPAYLCYGMTKLTAITIPNSVTSIGQSAFSGCRGLTSITIGDGVTGILERTFYDCESLTSVTIGSSVTSIGSRAFENCTSLTSITIPNSVKSIGDSAFYDCESLTSVTIPNSVTTIGSSTFEYCTGLTSITIPNSVTSIGDWAFWRCTGLTSVTIGNSVTSIGDYAFCSCTGLTSITIGNSVTSIGSSAFEDCKSLTSITIPNSVKSIGGSAFFVCSRLKKVNYIGDVRGWLRLINWDNNPIRFSRNLYINDVLLTDLVIPDGVTEVSAAFARDTCITSVTIPNSVTTIGSSAFEYCTGLTSMRVEAQTPPQCGNSCFSGFPKNIPVYVPCGTKEAYKNSTGWSSFTNIIDHEYSAIIQPSANGLAEIVSYTCDNDELTIRATANEHYHFTQWSDGNTDNPRTFVVFQDTTLTAEFAIDQHTISADAEYGRVEGVGVYDYGSTALLMAVANEHYHFERWSDDNTDNPRTVYVEDNATYTAIFAPNQYTISAQAEHGRVEGTGEYDYGTSATLTAIADEHYHFTRWSDDNTDNPRTVLVESEATYTAIFAPNQYTISAQAEHGYVEGMGEYDYGTSAMLTAIADEHYHFTQWTDGNTDNPRTIAVEDNATYTAEFAIDQFTITATADGNGYVSGDGTYDYGVEVILYAIADEHFHFAQWSDGNTDNPRTMTLECNASYTAIFAPNQYTISAQAEHGSVEGTGEYDYGTSATLTAVANEHYHFTQWSDGNTDNPRTVLVEGNATYIAEFALNQYTITATCDIQYGEVIGDGVYDYGTRITLTAIPNSGYEFKQWSNGMTYNPYRFTVVSDLTLKAQFIPATAIDNTAADTNITPQKVLIDGQVYILRNGKTYTITGVEAK